jgi:hypothetical protein
MDLLRRLRGRLGRIRDWQRGATGVEYALIISLLVVVSTAAINFVNDESRKEVIEQKDCVYTRPPPTGCQLKAASPTSPTTVDPTVTSAPAPSVPPLVETEGQFAGTSTNQSFSDGTWQVTTQLTLTSETTDGTLVTPGFVEGAVVTIEWSIDQPTGISTKWYTTCVTDDQGVCVVDSGLAPAGSTQISADVISIESSPEVEPDDITGPSWTRIPGP